MIKAEKRKEKRCNKSMLRVDVITKVTFELKIKYIHRRHHGILVNSNTLRERCF